MRSGGPSGSRVFSDQLSISGHSSPRVNELVFEVLRGSIVDGTLGHGLVLRESDVVDVFGVGRAPARMALHKLERVKLIRKRRGHGFEVAKPGGQPASDYGSLHEVGLALPEEYLATIGTRNWRQRIYPRVEKSIASCLVFGRFLINQSALAEYFGVSRTIAHEVLTTLERVGLVCQGSNARWYAGPMTLSGIKENYELRWLLEPEALKQSAPKLSRSTLEKAHKHVLDVEGQAQPDPEDLNQIELTLHSDIVLQCHNEQMRNVLRMCQLPVIVTYGTVVRSSRSGDLPSGVPETLYEHRAVLEHLLDGNIDAAAASLEAHIRHGFKMSLPHFLDPPPLDQEMIPPYMTAVLDSHKT